MKKIYILAAMLFIAVSSQAQVVISQVYGAGGNNGATYSHDFIELFNRGTEEVTLTGHTLQYASTSGTFNNSNIQTLPDITIPAGGYYLIQQSMGNPDIPTGESLPSPDLIPTVEDNGAVLALAAANGKIALASDNVNVTSPTDANVVDFVGYGTANLFEGSGAVSAISTTTSASRKNGGCQDTDDNANDFEVGTINPRNSATALNSCNASVKNNSIAGLNIYPNPATGNTLYVTSFNSVDKSVTIFDVLGKQVINTTTVNGAVNIANLNAGVYIVKVTEEGKSATRKLVVK